MPVVLGHQQAIVVSVLRTYGPPRTLRFSKSFPPLG